MFDFSFYVSLMDRAVALVKEYRMISKVTKSTTLTEAEITLKEILNELSDAKEPLKAAALKETGPEQKRIAALGVEIVSLQEKLQEKLTSAQKQLNELNDAEADYLGLPRPSAKKKTEI